MILCEGPTTEAARAPMAIGKPDEVRLRLAGIASGGRWSCQAVTVGRPTGQELVETLHHVDLGRMVEIGNGFADGASGVLPAARGVRGEVAQPGMLDPGPRT